MTTTMLDQGLYDAGELGWLLGHDVEWVVRWTTDSRNGPAIVRPMSERLFSFADLVSLRTAMLIRQRGISDRSLRTGVQTLRVRSGHERPLSHEAVIRTLATSGSSFLVEIPGEEFDDVGRGGQGVFRDVARIHMKRISFTAAGDPENWVPADGVRLDPRIQAGAPCLDGTRIPTATVAQLLTDAEIKDVALDLDLSVEAVRVAEAFEAMLAEGAGLPA